MSLSVDYTRSSDLAVFASVLGCDASEVPLSVTVIVPTHNEVAHIGAVLDSMPAYVDRVIVVDDASSDGTAALVEKRGEARVSLIRHETNRGVGAAMRTGYQAAIEAGSDLVVKMDGDGQMRPEELRRLLGALVIGLADYAKGNRFYLRDASADMPRQRSFGNSVFSFLTKIASGYWHVFDSQCGFTAVRGSYLKLIDLSLLPDDYFFENAMLIQLNAVNARVVDVPTSTIYGQEVSGIDVRRVLLTFPPRLLSAGLGRFWRKQLVTDFGAIGGLTIVGLLLCGFGVVFGVYHWWLSTVSQHFASTGTVMLAVLPFIVGVQLIVQAYVLSVQASPGAQETADYARMLIAEGEFERP